jgi:cytochrome o ubiquinol oxidase subunit 2
MPASSEASAGHDAGPRWFGSPPDPEPVTPSRRLKGFFAGSACLLLAACGAPVLTPVGPVGRGDVKVMFDAVALMLTIVVPTILLTLGFAWWYRASNTRAKRLPSFVYSGRIELVVWAIPLLTIMFLGGMIWIGSHDLDPAKPLDARGGRPLEVQVVSLDWKWLFIYPEEGVASVNTLAAPIGRPIHFQLTSASVMNAFFVPQLGSMIYTMNGMADNLNLQADKPGDYPGLSTMISGDGFADMRLDLRAVTPDQYAAWIAAAKANGPVLDAGGYAALSRQSANVKPFTYRAVQPGLFEAIVSQRIAPAPGPQAKSNTPVFPKPLEPK